MPINKTRATVSFALFLCLIAISGKLIMKRNANFEVNKQRNLNHQIARTQIRDQIAPFIKKNEVAPNLYFEKFGAFEKTDIQYTFDPVLQLKANTLLKQYKPDYASIVAIDATTGKVLALSSFLKEDTEPGNLAIKATFPAASIFKIIPASVALDKYKLESRSFD
jgi:peptidoglycan glycosyltransferase